MDIDEPKKESEQRNDIERALNAKVDELIPDEPEIDDILRRALEAVEEQEGKKAENHIIKKGKDLALKIREVVTLKDKNDQLQKSRIDLFRENEKLKTENEDLRREKEELELRIAASEVETNNNEQINNSPVICNKCEFQAQREDRLQQHIQTEHLVKCDFCEHFVDELQLQAHILTNHLENEQREENIPEIVDNEVQSIEPMAMSRNPTMSENVTSKCKLCNFSATQIENLRIHMSTRHKSYKPCEYFLKDNCRNGDQCRYNHVKLNPGEFICFQCGQKFSDKSSVSSHIKTFHSDMSCKRFLRNACKYSDENCYLQTLHSSLKKSSNLFSHSLSEQSTSRTLSDGYRRKSEECNREH